MKARGTRGQPDVLDLHTALYLVHAVLLVAGIVRDLSAMPAVVKHEGVAAARAAHEPSYRSAYVLRGGRKATGP